MTLHEGRAVIVGRPNAGKSTLLNALLGRKLAIVSPRPQTTRVKLAGVLEGPSHRIEFVDTPGTHRPLHRMNRAMMDAVHEGLAAADVIVVLIDGSEPGGKGTDFLFELATAAAAPKVLAINKVDLVKKPRLLPLMDEMHRSGQFAAIVPISARGGEGLDGLVAEIVSRLPVVEQLSTATPPDPALAFVVTEAVREALLARCGEELPYETAVRIVSLEMAENERRIHRFAADIVVERPGQKKIAVGKGGSMIREIGSAARMDLEKRLGHRIHLELRVVLEPGWREDRRFLAELPTPDGTEEGGG